MTEFLDAYFKYVEASIGEKGVYPQVAMKRKLSDDSLSMYALLLPPEQIMTLVRKEVDADCAEFIYGLDRTTLPDQGTEFADVYTCGYYNREKWAIGVINYQITPRIVRPFDWNNQFWRKRMLSELGAYTD